MKDTSVHPRHAEGPGVVIGGVTIDHAFVKNVHRLRARDMEVTDLRAIELHAPMPPCWACEEGVIHWGLDHACNRCAAPAWEAGPAEGGVYVLKAVDCGLYKIGYSRRSLRARVRALQEQSDDVLQYAAVLWAASAKVERWLHGIFADVRDESTAVDAGLACHTEWFWPTPTLQRLIQGDYFMRNGEAWENTL